MHTSPRFQRAQYNPTKTHNEFKTHTICSSEGMGLGVDGLSLGIKGYGVLDLGFRCCSLAFGIAVVPHR